MIATEEILLWPGAAPGAEAATQVEETFEADGVKVRNVVVPTLTPMLPAEGTANGTAVIVAPGGGYFMLSWDHEGTDAARSLCERGVTCFLLKYRLIDTGPTLVEFQARVAELVRRASAGEGVNPARLEGLPVAAADGARAVGLIRERAGEWGLRPDRIGLLGFSAGGFLGAEISLTAPSGERPDFLAAIYGGAATSPVPADAPPLFAMVAADDPLCYETTLGLFQAWRAAGRPAELHVYGRGGHGFGMKRLGAPADSWMDRLGDWLADQGLLPPAS